MISIGLCHAIGLLMSKPVVDINIRIYLFIIQLHTHVYLIPQAMPRENPNTKESVWDSIGHGLIFYSPSSDTRMQPEDAFVG